MTDRYVGPGGDNANSGLTWALRKLTLNGVEDTPVVAGDTVYVGPGTYREMLMVDVSGSLANIITFIGDVTGVNTDGVGGEVRITGSDDDKTENRTYCVYLNGRDYRTFRGFRMDMAATTQFYIDGDELVVEDCSIMSSIVYDSGNQCIRAPSLSAGDTITIRRCYFESFGGCIWLQTFVEAVNILIENCVFAFNYGSVITDGWAILGLLVENITVKNCSFLNSGSSVSTPMAINASLDNGNAVIYSYNNYFLNCGVYGDSLSNYDIVEDYGYFVASSTEALLFENVTKGANTIIRNSLVQPPLLLDGFFFPYNLLDFNKDSAIKLYGCAQSPPSEDFYGMARPVTDSKKTRGAIQFNTIERDDTTVPSGEVESIKMPDAMVYQIAIPITGKEMDFSVQVHREADYAGTNPQMIIKQPGQSDRTTTDVGAASQFNELSDTFTPADSPGWVVMEIKSNNTATSGSYDVFWGDFKVN